jgi:predicted sugar kinase
MDLSEINGKCIETREIPRHHQLGSGTSVCLSTEGGVTKVV